MNHGNHNCWIEEQKCLASIARLGATLPAKALSFIDSIVDENFAISVINKIELLGFDGLTETEEEMFNEFISAAIIFDLDHNIVSKTIDIKRTHKTKLPDAIIAATARIKGLQLIT